MNGSPVRALRTSLNPSNTQRLAAEVPSAICVWPVALLAMMACGGHTAVLRSGGPYPENKAPEEGVRYYVARDVVVVDAIVRPFKAVVWDSLTFPVTVTACSTATAVKRDSVIHAVSTMIVPDAQWPFRLAVRPSKSTKQTVSIGISEVGLLTAINYTAEDQTGEIITNVLKGVASIAGTVIGAGALAEPGRIMEAGKKFLPTDEDCFRFAIGNQLKKDIDSLESELRLLRRARHANTQTITSVTRPEGIVMVHGRDSVLARGINVLADLIAKGQAGYAAAVAKYAQSRGVGKSLGEARAFRYLFDVAELSPLEPTIDAITTLAAKHPRRLMAEESHLVLTVSEIPKSSRGTTPQDGDTTSGSLGCDGVAAERDCARIRYRLPRPRTIVVQSYNPTGKGPVFAEVERITSPLASSSDSILNVAFSSERFGALGAKLTFGRYGNPVNVEQSSSASMAGGSAAFVNALTQSRAEFQAGLTSVATAQTSIMGIQQAARSARIKELEDQKKLLDSEIALQGGSASRELLLQKQQLDTELALLTSRQALEDKQTPSATATLRAEIDKLKLELELLKAQQDLERARREAAAAERPPVDL